MISMVGETSFVTGIAILLLAFVSTTSGILILLKLLPGFVSREKKEGSYRFEDIRKIDPVSTKLPHLGGLATLAGITITLLISTKLGWVNASFRWFLIPIWGFSLVGFVDDYYKTRATGISEKLKLTLVFGFSLVLTFILYTRFGFDVPYKPYNLVSYFSLPLLWTVWFVLMSTTVTVGTTLSVGFSDGVDGLLGGLWIIAALAYAIPTTVNNAFIASAISFALAGAGAGFLIFNLPSSWASGQPKTRRRGKVYLGETGAMMVGSAFAFLAILSQTELAWIIIGGVFVIEGGSALYQAKILTPIFRRSLSLPKHLRNGNGNRFPHTEFPLPFLATPYHCHLDLLGFSRLRIVEILWGTGLVLGLLGGSTLLVYDLFGKAVLWLLGMLVLVGLWVFGTWTRSTFLGLHDIGNNEIVVAINRGRPYKLFGRRVYWIEEVVDIPSNEVLGHALLQDIVFWKSMSKSDALLTVGYMFYQYNDYKKAHEYWDRVPRRTLEVRKDMYQRYLRARNSIHDGRSTPRATIEENVCGTLQPSTLRD